VADASLQTAQNYTVLVTIVLVYNAVIQYIKGAGVTTGDNLTMSTFPSQYEPYLRQFWQALSVMNRNILKRQPVPI